MTGQHPGRRSAAKSPAFGLALSLLIALLLGEPAVAQQPELAPGFQKGRQTGYPVPRFVSLKSTRARMRIGPSTDYATKWVYTHQGMPFEITEEYGNWRRVRDVEGVTGWMSGALLSGERTAIVGPWLKDLVPLRQSASPDSRIVAQLSPKVMMHISRCDGTWCEVRLQRNRLGGYVDQSSLWGVYPGERFE